MDNICKWCQNSDDWDEYCFFRKKGCEPPEWKFYKEVTGNITIGMLIALGIKRPNFNGENK